LALRWTSSAEVTIHIDRQSRESAMAAAASRRDLTAELNSELTSKQGYDSLKWYEIALLLSWAALLLIFLWRKCFPKRNPENLRHVRERARSTRKTHNYSYEDLRWYSCAFWRFVITDMAAWIGPTRLVLLAIVALFASTLSGLGAYQLAKAHRQQAKAASALAARTANLGNSGAVAIEFGDYGGVKTAPQKFEDAPVVQEKAVDESYATRLRRFVFGGDSSSDRKSSQVVASSPSNLRFRDGTPVDLSGRSGGRKPKADRAPPAGPGSDGDARFRDPVFPQTETAARKALDEYARMHKSFCGSSPSAAAPRFLLVRKPPANSELLVDFQVRLVSAVLVGIATGRAVIAEPSAERDLFRFPVDIAHPPPRGMIAPAYKERRLLIPACEDLNDLWRDAPVVEMPECGPTSPGGMLPLSLFRNAVYRDRMLAAFDRWPVHFVARWLFDSVADEDVRLAVDLTARELFPKPGYGVVLGVELPMLGERRGKIDNAAHCAAREVRDQVVNHGRDVTIFAVSLPAIYSNRTLAKQVNAEGDQRALLTRWFHDHRDVIMRENVRVVFAGDAKGKDGTALGPLQQELLNQILLRRVDDMVVRRWSYFGYLAQTMSLRVPLHYGNEIEAHTDRSAPICQRMVDSTQGMYTTEVRVFFLCVFLTVIPPLRASGDNGTDCAGIAHHFWDSLFVVAKTNAPEIPLQRAGLRRRLLH
jgi:hypothetical protein